MLELLGRRQHDYVVRRWTGILMKEQAYVRIQASDV